MAKDKFTKNDLQDYIDKFEVRYLQDLLGAELYTAFALDFAIIGNIPTDAKFLEIWNPFAKDGYCGLVRSEGIKEMLVSLVHFEYVRDQPIMNNIAGNQANVQANSTTPSNISTNIVSNYNEGLKSLSLDWSESWERTRDYEMSFSKVVALRTQSIWKISGKSQSQEKPEVTKNVNQQFAREIISLNDTLQKDQTTLADQLNKEAENINNLKQSLNINQKFRFVNEIYDGDTNEFDKILDKIDRCKDYQEAILTLENNTNFRTERSKENQAVKELIDLVSKRFSEPGPAFGGRPFSTK